MKIKMLILLIALGAITEKTHSQSAEATIKEKMKAFNNWVGHWQGEGSMQMGPGEPKKSTVDEHIESRLDGMIMVVEGIGKSSNPETKEDFIVHHAFAVLSYDQNTNQYKFRTHLKDGRSSDAWFTVIGDNKYQWGFDTPHGKIRYSITIDPTKRTWDETGDFSADGTNWTKFFNMHLTKTE